MNPYFSKFKFLLKTYIEIQITNYVETLASFESQTKILTELSTQYARYVNLYFKKNTLR